ncbi:hypothetical protein GCM10010350_22780 [Streptomyces galilaeus]|nr:hypothetical protein GCM10010350_22780 [Streptomyces galilaeus]
MGGRAGGSESVTSAAPAALWRRPRNLETAVAQPARPRDRLIASPRPVTDAVHGVYGGPQP